MIFDLTVVVLPRTPHEYSACCCGRAGWPAGPVPISPLYCIGFGSCRSCGEQTRTPYWPPLFVSYDPFAESTLPLPSTISIQYRLLADVVETAASMRDGPSTKTLCV